MPDITNEYARDCAVEALEYLQRARSRLDSALSLPSLPERTHEHMQEARTLIGVTLRTLDAARSSTEE